MLTHIYAIALGKVGNFKREAMWSSCFLRLWRDSRIKSVDVAPPLARGAGHHSSLAKFEPKQEVA